MEKQVYKKIFAEMKNLGLKRGLSLEQSEDFAQRFILQRYVARTDQKTNEAFIDYIRHEYGDSRYEGGVLKGVALRTYLEIDDKTMGFASQMPEFVDLSLDLQRILTPRQYRLVVMRFLGYGFAEIGRALGISAPRAFQRLEIIRRKIKDSSNLQKLCD